MGMDRKEAWEIVKKAAEAVKWTDACSVIDGYNIDDALALLDQAPTVEGEKYCHMCLNRKGDWRICNQCKGLLLDAAAENEREACAQIAENVTRTSKGFMDLPTETWPEVIAQRIRSRTPKPKEQG